VLVIPAGESHTGEAAENAGWSYRAFYPDQGTLATLVRDVFKRGSIAYNFASTPLTEDRRLAGRLAALHLVAERAIHDPLARQQAFAAAMTAVLRRCARPGGRLRVPQPEPGRIHRAIDLARVRLDDQKLAITDLAEAAGLSLYHFMRCFRATTGVTAHAMVVQLRLAEARRLLAAGKPAAEIACSVGFADQSHLIRRFQAAFGVTPGQYARETSKRSYPAAA
jgi:AraC-like DNA-binding protein